APAAAQVVKPGEPPLTAQTSSSGGPLDPVQKLVRFQSADLRIEVLPDSQSIRGLGTLRFVATAPIKTLVIDLDRNLPVSAIAIDGKPLKPGT
ncbi:M1 family peptidase, partial [Escherichia coli]|nr:M1 family peptidase [Escherichia coli]